MEVKASFDYLHGEENLLILHRPNRIWKWRVGKRKSTLTGKSPETLLPPPHPSILFMGTMGNAGRRVIPMESQNENVAPNNPELLRNTQKYTYVRNFMNGHKTTTCARIPYPI